ncbi:MAG: hypothetical protein MJ237_07180 [bacterium]|nr:hypothetical protein [bacterium]
MGNSGYGLGGCCCCNSYMPWFGNFGLSIGRGNFALSLGGFSMYIGKGGFYMGAGPFNMSFGMGGCGMNFGAYSFGSPMTYSSLLDPTPYSRSIQEAQNYVYQQNKKAGENGEQTDPIDDVKQKQEKKEVKAPSTTTNPDTTPEIDDILAGDLNEDALQNLDKAVDELLNDPNPTTQKLINEGKKIQDKIKKLESNDPPDEEKIEKLNEQLQKLQEKYEELAPDQDDWDQQIGKTAETPGTPGNKPKVAAGTSNPETVTPQTEKLEDGTDCCLLPLEEKDITKAYLEAVADSSKPLKLATNKDSSIDQWIIGTIDKNSITVDPDGKISYTIDCKDYGEMELKFKVQQSDSGKWKISCISTSATYSNKTLYTKEQEYDFTGGLLERTGEPVVSTKNKDGYEPL